jgi:Zn-dependent peptidase ImmA (M78 family)
MSNDFQAGPLSDAEIEATAESLRERLGIPANEVPDIVAILSRNEIPTRYGTKTLSLSIVADGALEGDEARTLVLSGSGKVEIEVETSIWEKAKNGPGRSLMTLAHELGHAVLHEKPVPLARAKLETKRPNFVHTYESAEHQAKYFASAFLMARQMVLRFSSAEALARACRVSLQAATIRMQQCAPRERREIPNATRQIIADLKQSSSRPTRPVIQPIADNTPNQKRTIPPDTQKIIDDLKASSSSSRPTLSRINRPWISSDALKLWDKAAAIPGEDPTEWRQSPSGYRIKKTEFNKINNQGWFIENGQIHAALERHNCN